MLDLDALIVGFSVAGVAAAEKVARSRQVGLVDYPSDSASLEEILAVGRTPWNQHGISGKEFQQIALGRLEDMGVYDVDGVSLADMVTLADRDGFSGVSRGTPLHCRAMVFAPNGTEPGLSPRLGAERFLGWGLSHSAASDVTFFRGMRVAVLGAGPRAADDVVRAAAVAQRVYWLRPAGGAPARSAPAVERGSHVEVIEPASVHRLYADDRGRLRAAMIEIDGEQRELEISALFLAQDLRPSWSGLGGEEVAQKLGDEGLIVPAGVAVGVPYWDHGRLFASGVAAAETFLRPVD